MEVFINFGYLGLFLAAFLAATILPLSSEIVLVTLIGLKFNILYCFIFVSLGNWLGALTNYYLGYLGKLEWIEKYLKVKKEKIKKQQDRMQQYGFFLAAFSWLPFIGELFPLSLGFFKVNKYKVAFFMLLGISLRYIVVLSISIPFLQT